MTLLTMIQDVTDELGGLRRPSQIMSTTDQTARQLLALANREGAELAKLDWPILQKQITFTSTGVELQGDLETLAGEVVDGIVNDTLWDSTATEYLGGSKDLVTWSYLKNHNSGTYRPHWRIQVNPSTNKLSLYMYPAPASGNTISFFIKSKKWCANSGLSTSYTRWNADTDVGLLSESLMGLGIKWRWKAENKLEYAEDKKTYADAVSVELSTQLSQGIVTLDTPRTIGDGFPLGPDEGWRL